MGGEVVAGQATGGAVPLAQSEEGLGEIEDTAAIALRFANGAVGSTTIAWTPDGLPAHYSLHVLGTESSFRLQLHPAFPLHGISRGKAIAARAHQDPIPRWSPP